MTTLRELWETVSDAAKYGDWRGHIRAWWLVATGKITGGTLAPMPYLDKEQWRRVSGPEGECGVEE